MPIRVRIANGSLLHCTQEFSQCKWTIQGYTFYTDFRMLPLGCYDIILGMDWLEENSPMKVNWLKKTLSFVCQGKEICLHGMKLQQPQCCMVWVSYKK